jgi:hypothetical protein
MFKLKKHRKTRNVLYLIITLKVMIFLNSVEKMIKLDNDFSADCIKKDKLSLVISWIQIGFKKMKKMLSYVKLKNKNWCKNLR